MTDKLIVQSPKIAQQLIKMAGESGVALNITLNMNAQIGENDGIVSSKIPINTRPLERLSSENLSLLGYIERMPQPRMRNFIQHVYSLVEKEFGKRTGAEWLGVNMRTFYRMTPSAKLTLAEKIDEP